VELLQVLIVCVSITGLVQDASLERLIRESELLEAAYGHYFDLKIINNDIEDTIHTLQQAVDDISVTPQWIPVQWVY